MCILTIRPHVIILLLLAFVDGCVFFSAAPKPVASSLTSSDDALPDDDDTLMAVANENNRPDASIEDLRTAVHAYQRIEQKILSGDSSQTLVEIRWRKARACFFASEIEPDSKQRLQWIVRGEEVADSLMVDFPDRVEGYYYAAVLKGRRAQVSQKGLGALKLVKSVLAIGIKSVEIDASFDEGGPLRLLAMLYAKAPPWPASIGDMDLALENAQRAVELSAYPLNHLILAEVLVEEDDVARAEAELHIVLAAPLAGQWAQESGRWIPRARELLKELQTN